MKLLEVHIAQLRSIKCKFVYSFANSFSLMLGFTQILVILTPVSSSGSTLSSIRLTWMWCLALRISQMHTYPSNHWTHSSSQTLRLRKHSICARTLTNSPWQTVWSSSEPVDKTFTIFTCIVLLMKKTRAQLVNLNSCSMLDTSALQHRILLDASLSEKMTHSWLIAHLMSSSQDANHLTEKRLSFNTRIVVSQLSNCSQFQLSRRPDQLCCSIYRHSSRTNSS